MIRMEEMCHFLKLLLIHHRKVWIFLLLPQRVFFANCPRFLVK
jgi:hypothetical protein